MILKGYLFALIYAFCCLVISFFAYKLGLPKKYSRKLVHILVGAEWIILAHFVGASYHFIIVCVLFLAILSLAHFKNMMPMISSEGDNSPGTVYYAVAMTIMSTVTLFVPDMMLPFGIGVFCTSLGDGFAGLFGQLIKKYNISLYRNKSLFGALSNFVFSFGTAITFDVVFDMELKLWHCIVIGIFSVIHEMITGAGFDNITITLGTAFLAYSFIEYPIIELFAAPIVFTPVIIALVLDKRVLTKGGLILAIILDAVVSLTLGNFGFVLLAVFLFGSVAVDKIKKRKRNDDSITEKGECRDSVQVLANGLIPMLMAVLFSITTEKAFLVGYVAALAEAFADTCASGLGVYSNSTFDIFKMKKIKSGLSGGMSVVGTIASLIGAVSLCALSFVFVSDLKILLIASSAAFLGSIFDSFLGSLFQIKYKCRVCNEIIERKVHCNKFCKKHSGFEFFDNDVVNLFSGAFAAALATLICIL